MKIILKFVAIFIIVSPVHADFAEPPPPAARVYSTTPNYDTSKPAMRRFYEYRDPGYTYCSSGCDYKTEAYRQKYEAYHDNKKQQQINNINNDFDKKYNN